VDDLHGSAAKVAPGRPRDPDLERRIREATLNLLVERGYALLRVDDVARRAGVAKTTIYRRWPSLILLVLDTVEEALGPHAAVLLTGDVEADLAEIVRGVHRALVENPVGWSMPAVGIDLLRAPALSREYRRRFVDPLRDLAIALVRRGIAEGRFTSTVDPEAVVDAVAGSLLYRRLLGEDPPTADSLLALARALLHG